MWTENGRSTILGPAFSTINRKHFDCSTGWLLFFRVFYAIIITTKEDKKYEHWQAISERRKALRLTQQALAEKLNVSFQAVSKWENDGYNT